VATKILAYLDLIFTHLFEEKQTDARGPSAPSPRWMPPPVNWVFVNVDAAPFPSESRMGWGIVTRDHNGGFILSYNEGSDGFPAPELA
jgi:hypothetical protein